MGIKENFKEWREKLKKENPEKLKQINREKKRRWRLKKKKEQKANEVAEMEQQRKAGNLNFGIKLTKPKVDKDWKQFQKENPNATFWDFIQYKRQFKKPEKFEKIPIEGFDYMEEKRRRILEKMGLFDNTGIQLGWNMHHPEEEITDSMLEDKRQNLIQRIAEKVNRRFRNN